jgi:hypothetical protein
MNVVWSLLRAPLQMVGDIPRIVAGMTLAGRIALCVAVFQVLVVLLAFALVVVGDEQQVLEAWLRPSNLAVLAVLLALTPLLVYQAARLWLERDVSRFPDILEAWRDGVAALRRQGLEPDEAPLFLVIGARSDEEEERLLAESPGEFMVTAAPPGDAALHVSGGPDAIFVCLATCSRLSDTVRRGRFRPAPAPAAAGPVATGSSAGDIRGTVMVQDAQAGPPAAAESPAPPERVLTHTIDIGSLSPAAVPTPRPTAASATERDETRERFSYVCRLLRTDRAGVAPINGIVAVVPGDLLVSGAVDPQLVGQALGDDLSTALSATGVRAPVVALVLGLDREPGFVELISRMPAAERAGRLGQRFPAGLVPSYDQLGSLASRACGMVEDLVSGRLFRSGTILATANNDRLATLVARLRSELAGRLTVILRRALVAPDGETSERAPFVAGCYLAACGEPPDERAFVRGVIDRLLDCQGDLEWTQQEVHADARAHGVARVLWVVSGLLIAAAGIMVLWRMVGG